jgi:hypothetical protein
LKKSCLKAEWLASQAGATDDEKVATLEARAKFEDWKAKAGTPPQRTNWSKR